MAILSKGTKIEAGDTTAGGVYDEIEEVVSIQGPGGSAAVIDVTHLGSTAKEKQIGLADNGQIQLTCNFVPTGAEQQALEADKVAATRRFFLLTFSDGTTAEFAAYVLEAAVGAAVDDKVPFNVTLEIDGAITWTYSA